METYNYTLNSDFVNGINPTCLDRTIRNYELSIVLEAVNVEYETGDVSINFSDSLPPEDKNVLDLIISNHNPVFTCELEESANTSVNGGINFTVSDHANRDYVGTGGTTWSTIRSFVFSGTASWVPTQFLIIGSLSKNSTIASARLFDYTNSKELVVVTWENLDKQVIVNKTLTNLPEGISLIELQVKVDNKGTDARTHYMALY